MRATRACVVLAAVLVAGSPAAEAAACERGPEASSAMVAAAHPAAAAAGCAVLESGGGAIDAAVAVQAVLAVVEPQSSGLAGGTLITEYDRSARLVRTYEGLARGSSTPSWQACCARCATAAPTRSTTRTARSRPRSWRAPRRGRSSCAPTPPARR